MDITAKQIAENISELATFPEVAIRLSDAVADLDSEIKDISVIIESDPALSAALLRIANSPAYSVSGTVGSIEKAIVTVGLRELRDLVFGICASRTFDGIPNKLVSVEDFWQHSLYCASAAQHIARHARIHSSESVFTMGLLHDIGQLAMFSQCPEASKKAILTSLDKNEGLYLHSSEEEVFGFDHTDVGVELAQLWKFPESLKAAIGLHHRPYDSPDVTDSAIVIHAANSVAVIAELDSQNLDDMPSIEPQAMERLNLDKAEIMKFGALARVEVAELMEVFFPG